MLNLLLLSTTTAVIVSIILLFNFFSPFPHNLNKWLANQGGMKGVGRVRDIGVILLVSYHGVVLVLFIAIVMLCGGSVCDNSIVQWSGIQRAEGA